MYYLLIFPLEKDNFLEFKVQTCIIQKSLFASSKSNWNMAKGSSSIKYNKI